MLAGRMGASGERVLCVTDKRFIRPGDKGIFYECIELQCPRVGFRMHTEHHEVVDKVPTAQDQDTLFPERAEFFSDPEQEGQWLVVIQAAAVSPGYRPPDTCGGELTRFHGQAPIRNQGLCCCCGYGPEQFLPMPENPGQDIRSGRVHQETRRSHGLCGDAGLP